MFLSWADGQTSLSVQWDTYKAEHIENSMRNDIPSIWGAWSFLKEMVILPGSRADGWLGANVTKYRSKSNKADSRWQMIFVPTSSRRVWSTSLVRTQSIARDLESTCSVVAFLWNISGDLSTSLWPVFARQVNDGTGAFHDQHLRLGSETHRWLYLGQRLGQKKTYPPKTTSQNKAQRAQTIFSLSMLQSLQYLFLGPAKTWTVACSTETKVWVLDVYSWSVLLFLFGNIESQASALRVFPVFQFRTGAAPGDAPWQGMA